jgi:hypothetical protein
LNGQHTAQKPLQIKHTPVLLSYGGAPACSTHDADDFPRYAEKEVSAYNYSPALVRHPCFLYSISLHKTDDLYPATVLSSMTGSGTLFIVPVNGLIF